MRGGGRWWGWGNGTKADRNQEGAREGARWKMERDGREEQGKKACAVNVESWQSG